MAAYRLCKHISGLYLPQLNLSQEMTFTLMKFDGIRKRICSLILHNAISCSDQRAFKSHQSRSATLTGGFCIPYHKLSAIYLMELTRKKLQSSAGKKKLFILCNSFAEKIICADVSSIHIHCHHFSFIGNNCRNKHQLQLQEAQLRSLPTLKAEQHFTAYLLLKQN